MKIFVALTHEEIDKATLEDRITLLSKKGIPIEIQEGIPVVLSGTLEMWMSKDDKPGVLFTWYSDDEIVP